MKINNMTVLLSMTKTTTMTMIATATVMTTTTTMRSRRSSRNPRQVLSTAETTSTITTMDREGGVAFMLKLTPLQVKSLRSLSDEIERVSWWQSYVHMRTVAFEFAE